jgi:AbrB family looped-hinge helix DNA binding protein
MNDSVEVRVGPEGRVLIPAGVRRAAGLVPGSVLIVRLEGDRVVLIPRAAIKRHLRQMFADVDGSMAEELLAERRDEAARDTASS